MTGNRQLNAILTQVGDNYTAVNPEFRLIEQGSSPNEVLDNLGFLYNIYNSLLVWESIAEQLPFRPQFVEPNLELPLGLSLSPARIVGILEQAGFVKYKGLTVLRRPLQTGTNSIIVPTHHDLLSAATIQSLFDRAEVQQQEYLAKL